MFSPALSPMKRPWIVIACAAFIVTLAMGVRQSFGLFLPQMSVDIGISRSDFGLAMALQNLLFGSAIARPKRSEEHTSELQSLMRISSAVFCLIQKNIKTKYITANNR